MALWIDLTIVNLSITYSMKIQYFKSYRRDYVPKKYYNIKKLKKI
jgi:hypothetical protein